MEMMGRPSLSNPLITLSLLLNNRAVKTERCAYILPVSLSILTSSGGIMSGLYSRLHCSVLSSLFFASSSFHFAARMYRSAQPGSASHRASDG